MAAAKRQSGLGSFLRIYWYDAPLGRSMTPEQVVIAHSDHVKLRLGQMNSVGQQKGVDSLIVTDLIELARNHAISDALLLSGDEDVRIGVSIAQSYGVRVHLLGIVPSRGSQSPHLLQEADTTSEWDRTQVGQFLTVAPATVITASVVPAPAATPVVTVMSAADAALIEKAAQDYVATLDTTEIAALKAYWLSQRDVPSTNDVVLLTNCRIALGNRSLTQEEKRLARRKFTTAAQARP